jgi:hypothetical protein
MRIGPVGAELFPAGGQMEKETDVTKLIVAFGSSANASKTRSQYFALALRQRVRSNTYLAGSDRKCYTSVTLLDNA